MKKSIKYKLLTIPNKIQVDLKIITDDSGGPLSTEFVSTTKDFISLNLYPLVTISIVRPYEIDESGVKRRAPWNQNDSLPLTRYTLPIFLKEFLDLKKDLEIQELYTYIENRLELNDVVAEKIVRKFKVGNNSVELAPVVISLIDDSRVEGIKLKINNEESTVLLTLNDIESLSYVLKSTQFDQLVLTLYNIYKGNKNS